MFYMENIKNRFPLEEYNELSRSFRDDIKPVPHESLLGMLDLTSLNMNDSNRSVAVLVEKVNSLSRNWNGIPPVAGLCIFPRFVTLVRENLEVEDIKVVSVAASFPFSQATTVIKEEEVRLAANDGADEIDIVIQTGELLDGNLEFAGNEIELLKKACGDKHLKVILETGLLHSPELIYESSILALSAGADFIKTSTGKSSISATPEAAIAMCLALRDFRRSTGQTRGFKPAGGISTPEEAYIYTSIVTNILGEDWLNPGLFRIGASRLANGLLSRMDKSLKDYF